MSFGLASGAERRLDGLLTATGPVELVCEVPPRAGRKITMSLDIDGFPRAFVFDVPVGKRRTIFH